MKDLIARTRTLFASGLPLAERLDPALRIDIELFSRGGVAVLDAIERSGYDTLNHRPSLSKPAQLRLLGRALAQRAFAGSPNRHQSVKSSDATTTGSASAPLAGTPGSAAKDSEAAIRDSYSECNRIARAAHSSFYVAFFGLPREKRNALCALYAFNRLVDNISDEPGDIDSKRRGLARWRALLDEVAAGKTNGHVILPALADTISRYAIPTRYFHDLILGAEMDLTIASYSTFDRLSEYCYRVAGTVGLTCLHVFGFSDPRAPDLAERLGLAFQLTNIIRDVGSDYEMGRIYLPQEDLDRFGIRAEELHGPVNSRLQELLTFEAERAWQMYQEGALLVGRVNADSRATLWALVRTYSSLLTRIEEREFDVFSGRISLSSAEKIQYLLTAGLAARRAGWWKGNVLAKRSSNRRRTGGAVVRRRAG